MTDVLTRWIQNKLGLYIPHEPGDPEFNKDVANGRLIGEILRKYNIISDDQYIALQKDRSTHFAVCNMGVIHRCLKEAGFIVCDEEIVSIIRGVSGAATQLLYRLYLWLEIPKSRSALIGESGDCKNSAVQQEGNDQTSQCNNAYGDCSFLKSAGTPMMGNIGNREPPFNPALLVHVRSAPLSGLEDTYSAGACSLAGTARSEADGPPLSSSGETVDEIDVLPLYPSKLTRYTAKMEQYMSEMAEFDRAVCSNTADEGRWTEFEHDDATEYGISAWENFKSQHNEKREADDQRQKLYEDHIRQLQQELDTSLVMDLQQMLLSTTHRKSVKEETMDRLLDSSRDLKKLFADHIALKNAQILAEEQYLSSLTTADRLGKQDLISELELHEEEMSTIMASFNGIQDEVLKKVSGAEKQVYPEQTTTIMNIDEEQIHQEE